MAGFFLSLVLALAVVAVRDSSALKTPNVQVPLPFVKPWLADAVNQNKNSTWKATIPEGKLFSNLQIFKASLGVPLGAPPSPDPDAVKLAGPKPSCSPPKSFDARKKWPQCSSISDVLDQGHCGSCWAFGVVKSLTDRFCIHGNFTDVQLSPQDIVSCCGVFCGAGCNGGWPYQAWLYSVVNGVVPSACQPYFDGTGCKHPSCEPVMPTPKCTRFCQDGSRWRPVKYYAKSAYYVSTPQTIMCEVMQNGPIEVDFTVFEDFAYYQSGVYQHMYGGVIGGHAVKLIGWGTTDEGLDYWLLVNQWNDKWGEGGLFRMIRGTNECGIEMMGTAGMPNLTRGAAKAE